MAVGILIEGNGGKDVKKAFGHPLKEIPLGDFRYLVYTDGKLSPERAIYWAQSYSGNVQIWESTVRHLFKRRLFARSYW
jgi:hypothetical protein